MAAIKQPLTIELNLIQCPTHHHYHNNITACGEQRLVGPVLRVGGKQQHGALGSGSSSGGWRRADGL